MPNEAGPTGPASFCVSVPDLSPVSFIPLFLG
ncbi:hypothetical protein ABIB25_004966 [Nakamurella sp. UYEF19]